MATKLLQVPAEKPSNLNSTADKDSQQNDITHTELKQCVPRYTTKYPSNM